MDDGNSDARAPYEPPTIEDVPLRPDEQVLAGCKTSGGGTPGPGGAPFCAACSNNANS